MRDLKEIQEKIRKILDRQRYLHCLRVGKTAESLAQRYKVSASKARLAGLLHDIAKPLNNQQLIRAARKKKLTIDAIEYCQPKILHGPVSAIIANEKFHIKDRDILNAIAHHTTGSENMSRLEKIIYLADHIEPSRRFKGAENIRREAFRDLNKAITLCAFYMLEYLLKNRKTVCPKTIATLNYYLLKEK